MNNVQKEVVVWSFKRKSESLIVVQVVRRTHPRAVYLITYTRMNFKGFESWVNL